MKHKRLTICLIIFLLAVFPAVALAGSAILHWQPNTDPDLAGYRIYYGTAHRSYGPYIPVGASVTSYTLNGLVEGNTYYFALTAVDTSGNESGFSQEVSKTIRSIDIQPPEIRITSPTSGSTFSTNGSSINLSGSATDNIGVQSVIWSNSKGGSGTATGTTNWATSNIALAQGTNFITVEARDAQGNQGTDTLTVTYTPLATMAPSDTESPIVTISSPTTGKPLSTTKSTISLSGTATDNVGVTAVTWTNSRGGKGIANGTSVWTVSEVRLYEGKNDIRVE